MLGLRRFKKTQIDIWQGDITKFALDIMGAEPSIQTTQGLSENSDGLCDAWFQSLKSQSAAKKHLGILCSNQNHANAALKATKLFLAAHAESAPRRITFVAPSLDVYDSLQEALFAHFEDEAP